MNNELGITTTEDFESIKSPTLRKKVEQVYRYIHSSKMSLCKACQVMKDIRDNKLYEKEGFESFSKFSEIYFGISRSKASRMISTAERFMQDNNLNLMDREYSQSQMVELLPCTDEQVAYLVDNGVIDNEMTKSQIRGIVKKVKNGEDVTMLVESEGEGNSVTTSDIKYAMKNMDVDAFMKFINDIISDTNDGVTHSYDVKIICKTVV